MLHAVRKPDNRLRSEQLRQFVRCRADRDAGRGKRSTRRGSTVVACTGDSQRDPRGDSPSAGTVCTRADGCDRLFDCVSDTEFAKVYLWTIAINASVLTIWGIIQRANHNQEILPGIPYQSHGVPFASFGYKNAGAAALLPAIAITVALLVHRRRQGSSDRGYGTSAGFPSVHSLMLFSVVALLAAGLAVSLSRGAWIAAAAAAIVVAVIQRRKLTRTNLVAGPFLFAGLGAVAMIAAIALISRTSQPVFQRSADLSINRVQSDGAGTIGSMRCRLRWCTALGGRGWEPMDM